jgi:tRNA pseudouridine38-40 synthase
MTTAGLEANVMQRALNARLPRDVVVREAVDVGVDFDPRRHATRRHYRYVVDNSPVRGAMDRERTWYVASALDTAAMQDAASRIIGRHDFRAFASPMDDASASTVRDLQCFTVRRDGDRLVFDVVANAFLPHQVRRMVGALIEVGKGRSTPADYAAILDAAAASAGPAAPAHALYLMNVEYAEPVFSASLASEI